MARHMCGDDGWQAAFTGSRKFHQDFACVRFPRQPLCWGTSSGIICFIQLNGDKLWKYTTSDTSSLSVKP